MHDEKIENMVGIVKAAKAIRIGPKEPYIVKGAEITNEPNTDQGYQPVYPETWKKARKAELSKWSDGQKRVYRWKRFVRWVDKHSVSIVASVILGLAILALGFMLYDMAGK